MEQKAQRGAQRKMNLIIKNKFFLYCRYKKGRYHVKQIAAHKTICNRLVTDEWILLPHHKNKVANHYVCKTCTKEFFGDFVLDVKAESPN